MARNLPWAAANTTKPEANSGTRRPQKRIKTEPPASSSAVESEKEDGEPKPEEALSKSSPVRKSRLHHLHQRQRNSRSPSTSPPPGPPAIDSMIEGFDGDDVYMMVEDEFYDTAKTFTMHLHHAEYKRLMREAREKTAAKSDSLPSLPRNASWELKARQKRRTLEKRQSDGVKSLLGSAIDDGDEKEEKEDNDEDEVGDIWAGTTLAGLMKFDGSQKTSLKGLERITGDTRAAKGFGPSWTQESATGHRGKDGIRITRDYVGSSRISESAEPVRARSKHEDTSKHTTAARQETTERTGAVLQAVSSQSKASEMMVKEPVQNQSTRSIPSASGNTKASKPSAKRVNTFLDALDDFDEESFDQTQAHMKKAKQPTRASDKPRIKRENMENETARKPKDRFDEVPVFLVS